MPEEKFKVKLDFIQLNELVVITSEYQYMPEAERILNYLLFKNRGAYENRRRKHHCLIINP